METLFYAVAIALGFVAGLAVFPAIAYIRGDSILVDEDGDVLVEPGVTFFTKSFNLDEVHDGEIGESKISDDSEIFERENDYVTLICEELVNRGITEPSNMPFWPGTRYSDPNGSRFTYYPHDEFDSEEVTAHLCGLTKAEEEIVWLRIINDKKRWA